MKGAWIPNLLHRVMDHSFTFIDALHVILWRFGRKSASLKVEGLSFKGVDRTLWGLIANIFINREYTPPGFQIKPNDVVVDIGAHKGVFSGFASKRTMNSITAVEPDPLNFQALQNFVRDNELKNIEVRNLAVDAKSGETTLYQASSSSRHTILGTDQLSGEELAGSIKVKALSLPDLLEPFETVDFLKMDCEGAEAGILANTGEETFRKIRRLVAEVHWITGRDGLKGVREQLAKYYGNVRVVKTSANLGILYASENKLKAG